mmetsp:Transcript_98864/g.176115  ORF Transcript_98864/g.176115 Transcript_98864/m.176115 type:complete len:217 (-) Transcript_98864:142-792(-)|eukprot:CAMPEP_0197621606 /NCGR_PEP_ID=MMETSP1338-20131121/2144_1 /TAXON_ID=43686 ORGANISM="Pelagodinium beii, Strain RCC1491" /NCGR_SAMPLE_ID=MMETSP1338 /ASSEMBLY_ACC=CAM_ASM_000754 /LENGTH=216 /DNA_ID=CAMNT_0043191117 /DNA_START=190 /DNA_END=840 /DNA_ORIENTATION=-
MAMRLISFGLASIALASDVCSDGDLDCLEMEAMEMNTELLQVKVELQPRKEESDSEKSFHVGPFMANLAQQNISREELEKIHKIVSNASLMQEAKLKVAAGEDKCDQNTGGTCFIGNCGTWRGSVACVTGSCMCNAGFCAMGGKCSFDPATAMGAALGMGGSNSNDYPGGTCFVGNCDQSRGATNCGMQTGYQCKCNPGTSAMNGACMPGMLGMFR